MFTLRLPWYRNTQGDYIARTLAGVVKIKGNTFAPWYLRVSPTVKGYSVFLNGKRVSWVMEAAAAVAVASDVVKTNMRKRSRENVLPA